MGRDGRNFTVEVKGPDGGLMTLSDLPPPRPKRWTAGAKARIVAAVHSGLLSLAEANIRYELSVEEFLGWEDALEHFGVRGLRILHREDHRRVSHQKDHRRDWY